MLKVVRSSPGTGCTDLFYAARGAQEVLTMRVALTASRLNLPSPTPLSVAGCGRLKLEVANWPISVALLQVVDN